MAVSTNECGSFECIAKGEVSGHFQAVSNELNQTRILECPSDPTRRRAGDFRTMTDTNLSYFVGLDVSEIHPEMILSGDRNITTNGSLISGIVTLRTKARVTWTENIHRRVGNIGLADGSAQQLTRSTLSSQINASTNLPARLAIPK